MNGKELFGLYVKRVGGRSKAAALLGISVGMVGHIENGRRNVSINVAKKIEAASGGFLTRHDLRPDIFGAAANGPIHEAAVDPAEHVHPARKPHKHVHVRSRIPN